MICGPCKDKAHLYCVGGTWCDCQHREPDIIEEVVSAA